MFENLSKSISECEDERGVSTKWELTNFELFKSVAMATTVSGWHKMRGIAEKQRCHILCI